MTLTRANWIAILLPPLIIIAVVIALFLATPPSHLPEPFGDTDIHQVKL